MRPTATTRARWVAREIKIRSQLPLPLLIRREWSRYLYEITKLYDIKIRATQSVHAITKMQEGDEVDVQFTNNRGLKVLGKFHSLLGQH